MSVYTELLKVGIDDDAARRLADLERIASQVITKSDLMEFEAKLAWKVVGAMVGLSAIHGAVVVIALQFLGK